MLQLACTYHVCSEGIHIDKLYYRQVLKDALRQLFFSSKHLKTEPFKFEIINLQILSLWC